MVVALSGSHCAFASDGASTYRKKKILIIMIFKKIAYINSIDPYLDIQPPTLLVGEVSQYHLPPWKNQQHLVGIGGVILHCLINGRDSDGLRLRMMSGIG